MEEIKVRTVIETGLGEFLQSHNYGFHEVSADVSVIKRGELEIFLKKDSGTLYFECDLGDLTENKKPELLEDLLDLNTEILPVSVGIDKTSSKEARLVLVESREQENLDENEILNVIQTMEVALAKVEVVLGKHIIGQ